MLIQYLNHSQPISIHVKINLLLIYYCITNYLSASAIHTQYRYTFLQSVDVARNIINCIKLLTNVSRFTVTFHFKISDQQGCHQPKSDEGVLLGGGQALCQKQESRCRRCQGYGEMAPSYKINFCYKYKMVHFLHLVCGDFKANKKLSGKQSAFCRPV